MALAFDWEDAAMAVQRAEHHMILSFSVYAALAILPPTAWVCAQLLRLRKTRRQVAWQSTARVIQFPRERTKPRRAPGL
jgi:hypothetical protein